MNDTTSGLTVIAVVVVGWFVGLGVVLRLIERQMASDRRKQDRLDDERDERDRLDLFEQLEQERGND